MSVIYQSKKNKHRENYMNHFNEQARKWDTPEKTERCKKYAEKILKKINKKNISTILEFGCGTGLLGSHFLSDNTSLVGIDASQGMLDVFNEKFKNKNAQSYHLNLEEYDFPINEKFDLIVTSMAFHHLKNPENMMIKLKNLLNREGILAIIDLDEELGDFHPDPKNMGVHHFGFSNQTTEKWAILSKFKTYTREDIDTIKKESGDYTIFLALYFS